MLVSPKTAWLIHASYFLDQPILSSGSSISSSPNQLHPPFPYFGISFPLENPILVAGKMISCLLVCDKEFEGDRGYAKHLNAMTFTVSMAFV